MLADQRILEVSASHVERLREESRVAVDILSQQLKKGLTLDLVELMYRCLVSGDTKRRRLLHNMTTEIAHQNSVTSVNHIKEMILHCMDEDVQILVNATAARLEHVGRIQFQYCTDVFIPAMTDAHRFVIDRELKEIFDQLRLQQALKAQELELFGCDLPPPQSTGGAARSSVQGGDAPRSPLMGSISESEFQLTVEPSSKNRPQQLASSKSLFLGDPHSISRNPSIRRENSMLLNDGVPSSPLSSSKKAMSGVIPQREHLAAMQASLIREKELHAKLDGMNRALMERAAKERETVQLLQHQMEEAQKAATSEMQLKLVAFEAELGALVDTNRTLADRLQKTCEVAYVLDELCGKLNCEVIALKALLTEAGVSSVVHHRVEKAMEAMRTTTCCKGVPLVVESGHWKFGEAPDTAAWMRELTTGSKAVSTAPCLDAQRQLLAGVIDALSLKAENTALQRKLVELEKRLAAHAEQGLRAHHDTKVACMQRVATADTRTMRLLEENQKLRVTTARLMEQDAVGRTEQPTSAKPHVGGTHGARSATPSGNTTPRLGSSRPPSAAGRFGDEDSGMYLELCRCKAELNAARLEIALLKRNTSGDEPPKQQQQQQQADEVDSQPPAVQPSVPTTDTKEVNAYDDITRNFTPQLRAALCCSSDSKRSTGIVPQRPSRPLSSRRPSKS